MENFTWKVMKLPGIRIIKVFNRKREWYYTCMHNQRIAKNLNKNIADNFPRVRGMLH